MNFTLGAADRCEQGGGCARVFMSFVEDCYDVAMSHGIDVMDMGNFCKRSRTEFIPEKSIDQ